MNTFIMFGKYSSDAIKGMSAARTQAGEDLIKKYGGEIKGMYALQGKIDLILILTSYLHGKNMKIKLMFSF